jgi:hypothetical protein
MSLVHCLTGGSSTALFPLTVELLRPWRCFPNTYVNKFCFEGVPPKYSFIEAELKFDLLSDLKLDVDGEFSLDFFCTWIELRLT